MVDYICKERGCNNYCVCRRECGRDCRGEIREILEKKLIYTNTLTSILTTYFIDIIGIISIKLKF